MVTRVDRNRRRILTPYLMNAGWVQGNKDKITKTTFACCPCCKRVKARKNFNNWWKYMIKRVVKVPDRGYVVEYWFSDRQDVYTLSNAPKWLHKIKEYNKRFFVLVWLVDNPLDYYSLSIK